MLKGEVKMMYDVERVTSEVWEPITGTGKQLVLGGYSLEVSPQMDMFNSYRLRFREIAAWCADNARQEYDTYVYDLNSYLNTLPAIYNKYLGIMIKKAVDILISEGVWTVTEQSLQDRHVADYHLAIDMHKVTLESIDLTIQANQDRVASKMSHVPNMVGGGFGLVGALKGVATAAAFNAVRNSAGNAAMRNAGNIKPEQQAELFNRINPEYLFLNVFTDYWRVFLTLVQTLRENGRAIWWPEMNLVEQARNIFQNLSNPNFPQERVAPAFVDILKINPYTAVYHRFMVDKWGDTEETRAIATYFGYVDFDNPRIS